MRIAAVPICRPPKARAVEVACAPDVAGDLSALPATNFAHILGGATGGPAVRLAVDAEPRMYVYRAAHAGKRWMGLACAVDTRDLVHLFPNAASDEEIAAAQADLATVEAQLVPGLVTIDSSPELSYLYVCDTNERPAYHFVSSTDGSTHSAWEVRNPQAYLPVLAELAADEIRSGGAQVVAAHQAGSSPPTASMPRPRGRSRRAAGCSCCAPRSSERRRRVTTLPP